MDMNEMMKKAQEAAAETATRNAPRRVSPAGPVAQHGIGGSLTAPTRAIRTAACE